MPFNPSDYGTVNYRFAPAQLVGSDLSTVAAVPDSSGHYGDATQATEANKPKLRTAALAGRNILHFDSTDTLTLPAVDWEPSKRGAMFFLVRPTADQSYRMLIDVGFPEFSVWYANGSGGDTERAFSIASTGSSFAGGCRADVWHAIGMTRSSDTAYKTWRNGRLEDTTVIDSGAAVPVTSTPLNAGWVADFDIAEIINFSTFDDANTSAFMAAWVADWQLKTRNVVWDGDSLTLGADAPTPWLESPPAQTAALLGFPQIRNLGRGGMTVSTFNVFTGMTADRASRVDPLLVSGFANILLIWGGTNDRYFGPSLGSTYADLVAAYTTYLSDARTAGWKTVAFTLLPRTQDGTPGSFETDRQAFNTWIRAHPELYDALADVAADSRIGAPGASDDSTYYLVDPAVPGVHVNNAGQAIVAQIAADAINAADPSGAISSVSVSPATVTLYGGQTQVFTPTVNGTGTFNSAVIWSATAGSFSGATYTAPGGLASGAQSITVTATSTQDGSKTGTATCTVPAHTAVGSGSGGTQIGAGGLTS